MITAPIFGSAARGDARPESDVDVMLELKPDTSLDLFGIAGLRARLMDALGREVDIVTRAALNADRDQHILREAIRAF